MYKGSRYKSGTRCTCVTIQAGKVTRHQPQVLMKLERSDNHANTMWTADRGMKLSEADLWNAAAELLDDTAAIRQLNSIGREKRSGYSIQERQNFENDDDGGDFSRRYRDDHEQNNINMGKHRRRRPIDPTLLMMGIGRRK